MNDTMAKVNLERKSHAHMGRCRRLPQSHQGNFISSG
jgi:hypothetical protein